LKCSCSLSIPTSPIPGFRSAQEFVDRCVERWQITFHDAPHETEVDTEVIVRETISHPCDLLPWNVESARSGCLRNSLDCLADDLGFVPAIRSAINELGLI